MTAFAAKCRCPEMLHLLQPVTVRPRAGAGRTTMDYLLAYERCPALRYAKIIAAGDGELRP